jgi:histidyl-tRNA synthetase
MTIHAPTGVFDITPHAKEEWRTSSVWQHVEQVAKEVARVYGFFEIRTPIFEKVELFQRSVGDVTDIVSKEMYVFDDRGGRKLALRPEGTASVIRALIEEQSFSSLLTQRYYYIGPMFRYERPQAGRFRQHHQFGVEVYGIKGPQQDAELIAMMQDFYVRLGISHMQVHINSLGSAPARESFRTALVQYLDPLKQKLSAESQERLVKNPLRILDSKATEDQDIISKAPSILDFLSIEDRSHFEEVQRLLNVLGVPFVVAPRLVRGLDYYERTVFEVTSSVLGAQNSIGGGGRYDGLLKKMGGPDLASIGWGTGLERVVQALLKSRQEQVSFHSRIHLVIIPMGERALAKGFELAQELRSKGLSVIVDGSEKKLKNAVRSAVEADVFSIIVLGDEEIDRGEAVLKFLATKEECHITLEQVGLLAHLLNARVNAMTVNAMTSYGEVL